MCNVIVIPAYEPDERLIGLLETLERSGLTRIVVTDDGSGPLYTPVFIRAGELGCVVVRHEHNLGKGAAIRTGIDKALREFGPDIGIITADADGQHLPQDIIRISDAMASFPGRLILGVRDFSGENVPFRCAFGNRVTSVLFKFGTGITCSDTQTGLRGIPSGLVPLALSTEGDRYDYEMNFLIEAVKSAPLIMIPIETVYENGNEASHFRPVRDSLLIYRDPLIKLGSGVAAAGLGAFVVSLLRGRGSDRQDR